MLLHIWSIGDKVRPPCRVRHRNLYTLCIPLPTESEISKVNTAQIPWLLVTSKVYYGGQYDGEEAFDHNRGRSITGKLRVGRGVWSS